MNNTTLQIKIRMRLNKIASNDYDNVECWMVVEAFNKGQVEWCRRNLHGTNIPQEGDEQSKRRIDDMQILLQTRSMTAIDKNTYFETEELPDDYMEWKRLSIKGRNDCCNDRPFVVYLTQQADVDELLRDVNKKPSFDWAETFCTMKGNKIQIYTNNEFEVSSSKLTFYRQPVKIQVLNCVDPYTGIASTANVECEFKDDITELLIDEAVKILAGDIELFSQMQRAQQSTENNN